MLYLYRRDCVSVVVMCVFFFFFSSRRRHTRCSRDWSSDVCSSDLAARGAGRRRGAGGAARRGVRDRRAPGPGVGAVGGGLPVSRLHLRARGDAGGGRGRAARRARPAALRAGAGARVTAAFVVPRDTRLPRAAIVAIYGLVLLWAGGEVLRSLARVDSVVFTGYVQVGEAVLQGKDAYGGGLAGINTWPPFFFFVAAGLALLARGISLLGALFLWQLGGVLAIWGGLKLCARLYVDRGDTLTFWPRSADRLAFVSAGVLVPFMMMARLFQEHAQHTQINVQVLFLVLLAFYWFRGARPALGGSAPALAASVKAVPVALVLYLVYKRAWRETGGTLAGLVLLNLALPVFGLGPHAAGPSRP